MRASRKQRARISFSGYSTSGDTTILGKDIGFMEMRLRKSRGRWRKHAYSDKAEVNEADPESTPASRYEVQGTKRLYSGPVEGGV